MYACIYDLVGGYTEAPLTGYVLAFESEYACMCIDLV